MMGLYFVGGLLNKFYSKWIRDKHIPPDPKKKTDKKGGKKEEEEEKKGDKPQDEAEKISKAEKILAKEAAGESILFPSKTLMFTARTVLQ